MHDNNEISWARWDQPTNFTVFSLVLHSCFISVSFCRHIGRRQGDSIALEGSLRRSFFFLQLALSVLLNRKENADGDAYKTYNRHNYTDDNNLHYSVMRVAACKAGDDGFADEDLESRRLSVHCDHRRVINIFFAISSVARHAWESVIRHRNNLKFRRWARRIHHDIDYFVDKCIYLDDIFRAITRFSIIGVETTLHVERCTEVKFVCDNIARHIERHGCLQSFGEIITSEDPSKLRSSVLIFNSSRQASRVRDCPITTI
jgi:hypothetical protein